MRYVYATQFNVRNGTSDEVWQRVAQWFRRSYQRRTGDTAPLNYDGETHQQSAGHTVMSWRAEPDEGSQLLHLRWTHPDHHDDQLRWTTEVMLAEENGDVEYGVTLGISSQSFRVRPIGHLNVGVPGAVHDVLRSFTCGLARFEIPTKHVIVREDDVGILVEGVLESEDRALPVVLLSQDPDAGSPLCDVKEVQDRLTGLAHVYEIDREASFELTGLVGKVWSCFNGAVRLYWPGFDREGPYRRHTLYLPERIRTAEQKGRPLQHQLFRILSNVASARFREGKIWRRLKRVAEHNRHWELDALRERAKKREADVDVVLDELAEEVDKLRGERNELEDRVAQLEAEKANYEANIEVLRQQLDAPDEVATLNEAEEPPIEFAFDSVLDAVEQAENDFDLINIWSSAREAAGDLTFARPYEVYEAFEAIAELAELDASDQESVGPWKEFFERRGIKYAPRESEMTMNLHGDERIFNDRDAGKRMQMERHLTLGGGSRENCVQIFFDREGDGKFAIGYCGRHLPYASQST